MTYHANTSQKETGVSSFVNDAHSGNFGTKSITKDEEGHYILIN